MEKFRNENKAGLALRMFEVFGQTGLPTLGSANFEL